MKLNKTKLDIKNFALVNSKYESYLKQQGSIDKLDTAIKYLETFVDEDSIKMIKYLKENHYIDSQNNTVLMKGIMASEISECNEIMLTEIINQDFFLELEPAEIIAVLSTFIEEKSNDITKIEQLNVNDKIKKVLGNINYIATDFGDYEYNSNIDIGTNWNLYLSFIGPAYDWAMGKSIYEIYSMYEDIYEGTFIRNILRINNIIENIKNIASMLNNSILLKKLENLDSILIRDQVTTESLYIMK